MSRYTVTWLKGAQNHLAQIWVDATDQQAGAAAADTIHAQLAIDPENKGTPVAEGLKSFFVPPLRVLFSFSEPDRIVEVASVRLEPSPSAGSQTNGQAILPT
jgi:hypothetical protein